MKLNLIPAINSPSPRAYICPEERYTGFTETHFHEQLQKRYKLVQLTAGGVALGPECIQS